MIESNNCQGAEKWERERERRESREKKKCVLPILGHNLEPPQKMCFTNRQNMEPRHVKLQKGLEMNDWEMTKRRNWPGTHIQSLNSQVKEQKNGHIPSEVPSDLDPPL